MSFTPAAAVTRTPSICSGGSGGGRCFSLPPPAKTILRRAVVESVHKLDVIIGSKASYREVFKPENISLRNKLRELCVKLMFLHPVDYGRKAEELLWRKVYYEVIQVIKTNKKHIHSRSVLECAYRTHLIAGVGFYQHLLLYIQSHYPCRCFSDRLLITSRACRKKVLSASPKEMEWAQMACHRCLVYLGDLARYQNELAGVEAEHLAERFYHQALSVMPHVGMPFNQLGTLAGSKFYNVEATYYYLRCIQSESPFEGAYGNLKRLFDKAAKMYQQVKKQEMKKLSPSRQRDIKRLLVSFMYLQSLLQPKNSLMESELTSLCQSVLEDFNLVLFYLPQQQQQQQPATDGSCAVLPDALVFKMVVTCLMVVHSLKRGGSKQYSASIAFTLALFSHLVNHVNIRLQAELEETESQVPQLNTDATGECPPSEANLPALGASLDQCFSRWARDRRDGEEDDAKGAGGQTLSVANGPLGANDASISSNLQAMSSQLFQAKRCFRLAPTFSNMLLRPQAASAGPTSADDSIAAAPSQETPSSANLDSDSEGSQRSAPSVHSEKTLAETPDWPLDNISKYGPRCDRGMPLLCLAEADLNPDVTELLGECERPALLQTLLLPEDVALRHLPALAVAHRHLDFAHRGASLSPLQECVVRVCCIRSFGHFLTSLQGNVLHFNPEAGIFTSVSQSQADNLLQQAKAQFRMAEEEARRNRLMRDMAQLRLQLEVSQLEGSLQQPKAQSSMSPYLVPDAAALCQHLGLIRSLAASGCFIVIIPRTVIDGLAILGEKLETLHQDFVVLMAPSCCRYIRCQRESGRSFERDKLKRQDLDAWHLYKMVDSCRQLTVSQSIDDDTAGMVTLLTGHPVDQLCERSAAMKSAVQAASSAGMELKNIADFYRQWKEMG
uniref:Nonsense-mediated mRNA decay factor n=1 Tax=Hippocampus comes TaxID=109280 RepID=A0A3Q3DWM4_HIPCM